MKPAGDPFTRVGVVVPAHNEETLLPACLTALRTALAAVELPVHVLVVLDACTDATAATAAGVAVLPVWERNVGAARRAGFAHLIAALGVEGLWLATTDADSQVPEHWLTHQLAHARHGVDAVAGMVRVTDWSEHCTSTAEAFARLHPRRVGHNHVHGANLGISASAYLAVGGFPRLPAHEDVALLDALARTSRRVLHSADPPVTTSARRNGRAPAGFSTYLTALAAREPAAAT